MLGARYPDDAGPARFAPLPLRELAAALCALSAASGADAAQWRYEAAALYYAEDQGRVEAIEPVFHARGDFGDQRYLDMKLVVDVLTGASPNGATPAESAQTFTSPSQLGQNRVEAGELPIDDSFRDTRVAFTGSWEAPVGERGRGAVGWAASIEFDYLSAGINARYALGLNRNNTTLSIGASAGQDTLDPVGGKPYPLGYAFNVGGRLECDAAQSGEPAAGGFNADGTSARDGDSDAKTVLGLLLGLSQIVDPNTLLRVNYSATRSDGYLIDPYKLFSVIYPEHRPEAGHAPCRGPERLGDVSGLSAGDPVAYCYEARPDSRLQQNVYAALKRYLSGDVLDLSWRVSADDWGVDAHTLDARWRRRLPGRWFVRPRVRYHAQSAADFYRTQVIYGQPLDAEISADPRLAEMRAWTYGIELGRQRAGAETRSWSVAVEWYTQRIEPSGEPIGNQAGLDLAPDLDVLMLRARFGFGAR